MAKKKPTTESVSVQDIKLNDSNPRYIKEDKFHKLVKSIKDFPEMLEVRPLVINQEGVVLGGNMRFQASVKAGLKQVPCTRVDWSEAKQKEFIIKDNVSGGEWDWDALANEWDAENLEDWGLDLPLENLDDELMQKPQKFNIKCIDDQELVELKTMLNTTAKTIDFQTFKKLLSK